MKILHIDNEEIINKENELNFILNNLMSPVIKSVSDTESAIFQIKYNKFDLFIINISTNNQLDAIKLVDYIYDDFTPIIFISPFLILDIANKIKSMKNAIYLVKPFHNFTLESSIRTILRNKEFIGDSNSHHFKINNQQYISINSIVYIEVDSNYCYIHTIGKKYVMKISLNQILNKLPNTSFIVLNRNFAVNKQHIKVVDFLKDKLVTSNNIQLSISKRQGKSIKQLYSKIYS